MKYKCMVAIPKEEYDNLKTSAETTAHESSAPTDVKDSKIAHVQVGEGGTVVIDQGASVQKRAEDRAVIEKEVADTPSGTKWSKKGDKQGGPERSSKGRIVHHANLPGESKRRGNTEKENSYLPQSTKVVMRGQKRKGFEGDEREPPMKKMSPSDVRMHMNSFIQRRLAQLYGVRGRTGTSEVRPRGEKMEVDTAAFRKEVARANKVAQSRPVAMMAETTLGDEDVDMPPAIVATSGKKKRVSRATSPPPSDSGDEEDIELYRGSKSRKRSAEEVADLMAREPVKRKMVGQARTATKRTREGYEDTSKRPRMDSDDEYDQ
jgi:hypothetical protein